MSNLSNEEALINAVAGCPGASAGAIAHHLGMDRSNARRDLKKLCRDGKLIGQDTGNGYAFYPIGDRSAGQKLQHSFPAGGHGLQPNGHDPVVDLSPDAWHDITDSRLAPQRAPSSAVIVHRMPGTPTTGNRVLVPMGRGSIASYGGDSILPAATAHGFNSLFALDPEGIQTTAWLGQQLVNQMQQQNAQLQAALELERQRAADAKAAAETARKQAEWTDAIFAITRRSAQPALHNEEDEQPRMPSLLEEARRERAERRAEADELNEMRCRDAIRRQQQRYPADQYPGLYAHLAPEDGGPVRTMSELLSVETVRLAARRQSGSSRWPIAIVALAACIVTAVFWPLRQM